MDVSSRREAILEKGSILMIKVWKSGTQIKLEVDPGMSDKSVMYFYWNCGTEWYTELLRKQLDERLRASLQKIREDAYNDGWKDAKAKKMRRTWFSGLF